MRKIFTLCAALVLIFPAMSWGAAESVSTIIVNGIDTIPNFSLTPDPDYTREEKSGDVVITPAVKGTVTFPAFDGNNYTFSSITEALEFANNPQVYITEHYTGYYSTHSASYDIAYDDTLKSAVSPTTLSISSGAVLDSAVKISDYSNLNEITFTSGIALTGVEFTVDASGKTVIFSRITFDGASGGKILVSDGTVEITGCTFKNFADTENGGALSLSGGTTTIASTNFNNCNALNGGAVYISGNASATFSGGTFSGCTASDSGGAISISGGASAININGTTFRNCEASNYGGGISVSGSGSANISGVTFNTNTAYSGGGISARGAAAVSSTNFANNDATYGGALYVASSVTAGAGVNFNTSDLASPNKADYGGAVYIQSGQLKAEGTQINFTQNEAQYSGGAVYIRGGALNITGDSVNIDGNTASQDGGAIYVSSGASLTFSGNNSVITANTVSDGNGGAIFASGDKATVTVSGTGAEFSSNSAGNGHGGAILAGGRAQVSIGGGAKFTDNTSYRGGAIYLARSTGTATSLRLTGSTAIDFSGNTASQDGGAIYADTKCVITVQPEVNFSQNIAMNGSGGALWTSEASQLPEGTLNFTGNSASHTSSQPKTEGSGGAIYVGGSASSSTTLGNTRKYTFTGNSATRYGGALCTYSSDVAFDTYTVTEKNTALLGGGFVASYNGKITLRNSSFSNQETTNGSGGVAWAKKIEVNSSDFNGNMAGGEGSQYGGGALYAVGSTTSRGQLTITNSTFSDNVANQGGGAVYSFYSAFDLTNSMFTGNTAKLEGGAIYAETSTVAIEETLMAENKATEGYGGALVLHGGCTSTVTQSTFRGNVSSKRDGGAIFSHGKIEINLCYFKDNHSLGSGGAIYFDQNDSRPSNYSRFVMTSTMIEDNGTLGAEGNGGGLFVKANDLAIDSCTFWGNRLNLGGNSGKGGGAYVSTMDVQKEEYVEITNCTFYDNHIDRAGSDTDTGGGGIAVICEKNLTIKSCTFTLNGSQYNGGAIYIDEGAKVQLSGTIAVGNTDEGDYDVFSDGNISSGGYNRVGVYGIATGVTNLESETRDSSTRTAYPSKGWTKATFFSDNVLAVNAHSGTIPPVIGSEGSTARLLTLMLKEEETLAIIDRATNVIPNTRKSLFPTYDERGVARVPAGTKIGIDIGACFFDGTRITSEDKTEAAYTISRIQISGIPSNLKRVGQVSSLLARVYYTNGRSVLGGKNEGEEPIEWLSDKPSIVSINRDTGDIVVKNITPGNTYVTITARTLRGDASGKQVSDSKALMVTEYTPSYLNVSPSLNRNIQDYRNNLTEYDITLDLADVSSSAVNSESFQSSFASLWGGLRASQVTDLTNTDGKFSTSSVYKSYDGYEAISTKTGVSASFSGMNAGDMLPLVYTWTFTGDELSSILGYNMAGKTIDATVADEIFSSMRIDFEGASNTRPVIGTGGVKASEAMKSNALSLQTYDNGRGLHTTLTAYIANITADDTHLVDGLVVVPDGNASDGLISGTMWMTEKSPTSHTTQPDTSTGNHTQNNTKAQGSSGGGGCNVLGLLPLLAVIVLLRRQ